jgi:hypothetical protein
VHQGILKDIPHLGGTIVLQDLNAKLEDQLLQPGLHLTWQFGELSHRPQWLGLLSRFLVRTWLLVRTLVERLIQRLVQRLVQRLIVGLWFITYIAATITDNIIRIGVTDWIQLFGLVIPRGWCF